MKKILILLLSMLLSIMAFACSGTQDNQSSNAPQSSGSSIEDTSGSSVSDSSTDNQTSGEPEEEVDSSEEANGAFGNAGVVPPGGDNGNVGGDHK